MRPQFAPFYDDLQNLRSPPPLSLMALKGVTSREKAGLRFRTPTLSSLCVLSRFSCVRLCDPMDCNLPGSSDMGFSRQEYWSGLPCLTPGDLPHPGIVTPLSVTSKLYRQASSLLLAPPGKPGLCLDLGKVPEPFWAYFSLWENGCHDTCSLVTSRHCKEAPNHRRVCTSKCILSGYVVMSDFNCYNS